MHLFSRGAAVVRLRAGNQRAVNDCSLLVKLILRLWDHEKSAFSDAIRLRAQRAVASSKHERKARSGQTLAIQLGVRVMKGRTSGSMKVSRIHAAVAAALGAASFAGTASAQLDEIIVTATFRETNVQDTPIAITAVNAELLASRGQTNIVDVANQAPNVTKIGRA